MAVPEDYAGVKAHEAAVEQARETKEDLSVTWSEFLEHAAEELSN